MDQQTMIVLIAAIVIVAFIVILLKRSGSGSVTLPGGIKAEVKGEKPGATVRANEVEGDDNRALATGPGALIEENKVKGTGNEFKAS